MKRTFDNSNKVHLYPYAMWRYATLILGYEVEQEYFSRETGPGKHCDDAESRTIGRELLRRVRDAQPLSHRCVSLMVKRRARRLHRDMIDEFAALDENPLAVEEGPWGVYLYDGELVYVLEREDLEHVLLKTVFYPFEEIHDLLNEYVAEETGVTYTRRSLSERPPAPAASTSDPDDAAPHGPADLIIAGYDEIDVDLSVIWKYGVLILGEEWPRSYQCTPEEYAEIVARIRRHLCASLPLSNRSLHLLATTCACGRPFDMVELEKRCEAHPREVAEGPWGWYYYDGEVISIIERAEDDRRLRVRGLCFPHHSVRKSLDAQLTDDDDTEGPPSVPICSQIVQSVCPDGCTDEHPNPDPLSETGTD